MQAVRVHRYPERPSIDEIEEPKVQDPLDVIVKIGGAGLCRTDIHLYLGQWAEARATAARLMPADRAIVSRYGLGGLKAALDLQGFYGGPCRLPLPTPDGDAIEDIKELLATAGLL